MYHVVIVVMCHQLQRCPIFSDEYEKEKWVKAIPRKNLIIINKYTVVSRLYWPIDCKSFTSYCGKECSTEPPTVFPNIPSVLVYILLNPQNFHHPI